MEITLSQFASLALLSSCCGLWACSAESEEGYDSEEASVEAELTALLPSHPPGPRPLTPSQAEGREVWFKRTFGGEKFFSLILPKPPFNLPLGLDIVLRTPRAERFDRWGVVNDPDCRAGDASSGGYDRCADAHATGVVGVRRFPNPTGDAPLLGVSCASCHAGFDPVNPPKNPNHPRWSNIHPTIGNQHIQIGKMFAAHLAETDPRWQVFHSWAPGTVDTTLLENDHINNPGAITPIFNVPSRPYFDQTREGEPIRVHRSGQGGEDDVGCELAALRVYFNIGMCAAECMVGHLANGPGGSQTEIDLNTCRQTCSEFRDAEQQVKHLCAFLDTAKSPRLVHAPGGFRRVNWFAAVQGARVFKRECASCHSSGDHPDVLSNDEVHPASVIGTNSCRSRTTNWMEGHIWGQFSSDQYKARPTRGPGYYRNMPLHGVWATAPFFHNERLGAYTGDPSVDGRLAAYESAMQELLSPERRDLQGSIQRTTVPVTVPSPTGPITLPAGTPVNAFASADPKRPGASLCPDWVENAGHTFGSNLSAREKHALTEFLKTR
jgi:hypothetical protein